jgi:arginine/lysine/histidine transport system permease protein
MINSSLLFESLPHLLRGLLVSLEIAFISSCIGVVFGLIIALGQRVDNRFVQAVLFLYVNIIRGTPMLIQILFAYYVLPQWGVRLDPFWTASLMIGLNSSAYISQVMRSGIQSIAKGQWEAAYVLGFSNTQTLRFIILPQAIKNVLPSLANEFITLIKDSSLASIIGVTELAKEGRIIISRTYDSLTIFAIVGLLYIMVTWTVSYCVYRLEKRMNTDVYH